LVAQNRFGSLLFYGPPGCGKTSIAEAIARETRSRFVRINAVMSNVAELREILAEARRRPESSTLLFIRRVHPVQQVATGPAAAGRRGGRGADDRGDADEPWLLRQPTAVVAQPSVPAGAFAGRGGRGVLRQALVDAERGLGTRAVGHGWHRSSPIWPRSATAICAGL
jgi:putative ATPase